MASVIATSMLLEKDAAAERVTYYDGSFCGHVTAAGSTLDCSAYVAAHPTLPLGSMRRVCFEGCVDVEIVDRGPTLDLSPAAADAIGMTQAGVIDA